MTATKPETSFRPQASFSSLSIRHLNSLDALLLVCVVGVAILVGNSVRHMLAPLSSPAMAPLHLNVAYLPGYALRTTLRMFVALVLSLVFTFCYATLAAKNRRAEQVLIPLLDVLQSVPILGFLTFTVTFFLGLFPGRVLGAEFAAIFTIFTSQAWNLALGMYQSLKNVPDELEEAARCFGLTSWQKFWRLEVPCAVPSLVWNSMMSMAGGWFMVVYSETITVGNTHIVLPGIGSYVGVAITQRNIWAVLAAIIAMLLVILAYDQIVFRPLASWATRFRLEAGPSTASVPEPWILRTLRHTRLLSLLGDMILGMGRKLGTLPLGGRFRPSSQQEQPVAARWLWWSMWAIILLAALEQAGAYASAFYTSRQIFHVFMLGCITLLRVVSMVCLASIIWVPVGVWLGLDSARARRAQLVVQYCAAFPANLFFPIFVVGIIRFDLVPDIWLTPLMILGAQWYILFNVIGGTSSFPGALLEVGRNFNVSGMLWWRKIMLPGIIPYYLTGVMAASGGAWNAAVASEMAQWGDITLKAHGIGSYIAQATVEGSTSRVALGVVIMSLFVMTMNWVVWRPLSEYAYRRLKFS
ncbi:ABC transporter permease [Acetobacter senegalensis]|uniref:ABC transporter permease n=1 Tax=Acetobacter senegalensis TaxID=446692 RepID=UPI002655A87D|nr:ABC transporter permease subunit [Acetobacter senegalensis]MDN7350993.1 ABC transporter permease subunit [Acetobacter senegalensis]